MSRARSIRLLVAALAGTLALLATSVPAQAATLTSVPYCGSLRPSGGWDPVTLQPGQACSFAPVAVHSIHAWWDITHQGTSGSILVGVIQSPPGYPNGQVLSPYGGPGQWYGYPPDDGTNGNQLWWFALNGFNAVSGQPVILNYSNYTIRLNPNQGSLTYYY